MIPSWMDCTNASDHFSFSHSGTVESSTKGLQKPPGPDRTQLTFAGGLGKLWMEPLSSSPKFIFFCESTFSECWKRNTISNTLTLLYDQFLYCYKVYSFETHLRLNRMFQCLWSDFFFSIWKVFFDGILATSHTTSTSLSSARFHHWLKRQHKLDSDKSMQKYVYTTTSLIVKLREIYLLGFGTLGVVIHAFSPVELLSKDLMERVRCPVSNSM